MLRILWCLNNRVHYCTVMREVFRLVYHIRRRLLTLKTQETSGELSFTQ